MVSIVRGVAAASFALFGVLPGAMLATATPARADIEQRFDDWKLLCQAKQPNKCLLTQVIRSADTNDPIVIVGVFYLSGESAPYFEFRLPPQVVTDEPMQLRIDNNPPFDLSIDQCKPSYCVSGAVADDVVMGQLRGSKAAVVSFVLPTGERTGVKMSLKGFTAALRALDAKGRG